MRAIITFLLIFTGPALAQPAPKELPNEQWPLQKRINAAIDKGVRKLKETQGANGLYTSQFGPAGPTALALYTLAASGVPASDPAVARAVAALRRMSVEKGTVQDLAAGKPAIRMTYTHSLVVLAFATLDPVKYKREIQRSVRALVAAQTKKGQWAYILSMGGPLDGGDNSNTQFALLALRVASLKGFKVPSTVFKRSLAWFQRTLAKDGGWGYGCPGSLEGTYGSMTAVGIASLVIARAALLGPDKSADHVYLKEREIARGMIWLEDHFAVDRHPGISKVKAGGGPGGAPPGGGPDGGPPGGGPGGGPPGGGPGGRAPGGMPGGMGVPSGAFHYYWLYAVERVGMLLGRRFIGNHDWYQEGAEWLVAGQRPDGSWENGAGGMAAPEPPLAATCFALLFLKRATIPVVTPPPVEEGK